MTTQALDEAKVGEFCGRLFMATIDAIEVVNVYFGDKLGIYEALVTTGPVTAPKLAEHLGLNERYLSEWLTQQAIAGFIDAENGTDDGSTRRYSISPEHAVVLTNRTSPEYMGFAGKLIEAVGRVMPKLLDGFKTGKGVSYAEYGPEAVEAQSAITLPGYINSLVQEWVPGIPGLTDKLSNGARIAELASGAGVAAVTLAKAFPTITIEGFDLDEASVAIARKNAQEAGVADRVTFTVRDVRDPKLTGAYDAVFVFEAVHDMGDPVPTLETLKRLAKPDGIAVVVDEKVQDTFTAPGDEVERFMAGASTIWCLPQGLADGPNAHGTLMRASDLDAYAKTAGWAGTETLPIDHPSWRFYRLVA